MRRRILRLGMVLAALSVVVLGAPPSGAQSAADKATARELAKAGIEKFNEGDPSGALKNLEKAQALYDAPIHLLYIARSQEKLGQLVEAAETYRSLARVKLGASAPSVFREAKKDGREELDRLEPRIARLTIDVQPEGIDGLVVQVDGMELKTAVLSVARPSNPGTHQVTVTAPGYFDVSRDVELSEGGSESVTISLERDESVSLDDPEDPSDEDGTRPPRARRGFQTGPWGLIFGIRAGGYQPLGLLQQRTPVAGRPEDSIPLAQRYYKMSDYYGTGGYGRVHVGFRFLKYLFTKAYIGGGLVSTGSAQEDYAYGLVDNLVATASGMTGDVGLALGVTSNPRRFGGYGEVGFSFLHGYRWQSEVSGQRRCKISSSQSGLAGRAEAGLNVPLHKYMTLTPFFDFSFGSFNRRSPSFDGCPSGVDDNGTTWPAAPEFDTESIDSAMHYQLFFGLGFDIHFGDDWFR